jgi:lysylphosphatidylglycerol synthetase-like protein (DUF2156 family)
MADDNDLGTTGAARGGSDTGTLYNIARGAKAAALLFFVLPFVTVSCAGTTIGQITGMQLATGTVGPIGQNMPGAPTGAAAQNSSVDVFALAAALLILAGLAVTFVLARRRASMVAMIFAGLAAVLIAFDVLVRIKSAIGDRLRDSAGAGGGAAPTTDAQGQMQQQFQQQADQVLQQISVNPAIGFWLCMIALIAAIVLFNIVRNRSADL